MAVARQCGGASEERAVFAPAAGWALKLWVDGDAGWQGGGLHLECPCTQSFKYRLARPLFRGIEQTDLSFRVISIESFEL